MMMLCKVTGDLRRMATWRASMASTAAMKSTHGACAGKRWRAWMVNATSREVTATPSCHFAPGRMRNTIAKRSSVMAMPSARRP